MTITVTMRRGPLTGFVIALATACASPGTDPGQPDASPTRDASALADAASPRDASAAPDASAEPDAETGDRALDLDAGDLADGGPAANDAEPTDADTIDGGAGACPCTFTEHFASLTHVDAPLTTATVDTASAGFARASAPWSFLSTGSGAMGAFAPTAGQTLAGGTYEYSSVQIAGVAVNVTGDLDLRVAGPFTVSSGGQLRVTGRLTIVAASTVAIDCAFLNATDDIMVQQPGGQGVWITCGASNPYSELTTNRATTGDSGSVDVWTRGPLVLGENGYLTTGRVSDPAGRSGSITVRAYGDVIVGPSDAYFIAGDSAGANGDISVFTEGNLVLDQDSYFICGRSNGTVRRGGTITTRARGRIELHRDSYFITSPQGDLDVVSESDIILDSDSYFLTQRDGATPTELRVRARSLSLAGSTSNEGGYVIANNSATGGGRVVIDVREGVTLRGSSYIGASDATCGPGGDVIIRTEGDIALFDDATISAGASSALAMCMPQPGGSVTGLAGGAITAPPGAIAAGTGSVTGTVSVTMGSSYLLGILDAELVRSVGVTSIGLPLEGDVPRTVTATAAIPAGARGGRLWLSTSGSTTSFVPARMLTSPLMPGWRYRLELEARMFDGVSVDGFTVDYR